MSFRPGHHRPLGTTWRMRLVGCTEEPVLDSICVEEPPEKLRAYRVAGIEEHRDSPRVWWVVLERIAWDEFLYSPAAAWSFRRL